MLRTRVLSAVTLVIPVAILLWLGGTPWLAAIALVAALAIRELIAALRSKGYHPFVLPGAALALLLPCAAYVDATLILALPIVALVTAASLALALLRPNLDGALADWALSLAGSLYVTLLLAYFVALRQVDHGLLWIVLAFLCTWACDSAAYLVGRAIGRRPFSPRISPKKTWEGTVGGVVAGALTGLLAVPLLDLPLLLALSLGCVIAIAAVVGDLAESFIKRQLGIKDSGTLIPGHGGVLDRIDSLLFAVPLVYYVATLWGKF